MQTDCGICYQGTGRLYNLKCPNCLECGYRDRLVCSSCLSRLETASPELCPWCRQPFDQCLYTVPTWRAAPRFSRLVTELPKKKQNITRTFSRNKVVPVRIVHHNVVKEEDDPFFYTCCIIFQDLMKCFFGFVGLAITGYGFGIILCHGNTSCSWCNLMGVVGMLYTITLSLTVGIALKHDGIEHKEKVVFIGQCCSIGCCTILLALMLGTMGSCTIQFEQLVLLLFLMPCYVALSCKCFTHCLFMSAFA